MGFLVLFKGVEIWSTACWLFSFILPLLSFFISIILIKTFSVQKNSPFFYSVSFLSRFKLCRWKINGILTFLFIFLPFLLLISPFPLLGEMVGFTVFHLFFFTVFPLRLRGLTSGGMYSFEKFKLLNIISCVPAIVSSPRSSANRALYCNDFTTTE